MLVFDESDAQTMIRLRAWKWIEGTSNSDQNLSSAVVDYSMLHTLVTEGP